MLRKEKLEMEKLKSNEQGVCPFCGEVGTLDYDCVNNEGNMCYYKWHCMNCNHDGEEWYTMEFIGQNIIDENGDNIEVNDEMIKKEDE
jgi:C4-type Zn-finger protein